MHRFLTDRMPTASRPGELTPDEATHAIKVLRLGEGDLVEVLDGNGGRVHAKLRPEGKRWLLDFVSSHPISKSPDESGVFPITLEVAMLKGEAMEWVVEKAVELGVEKLIPVISDHCTLKIEQKGPEHFQQRWQRTADQALKQCGRPIRMIVELPTALTTILAHHPSERIVAIEPIHVAGGKAPLLQDSITQNTGPVHLLIGPEGGWSQNELALMGKTKGLHFASFGKQTLRAETACLYAISVLRSALQTR